MECVKNKSKIRPLSFSLFSLYLSTYLPLYLPPSFFFQSLCIILIQDTKYRVERSQASLYANNIIERYDFNYLTAVAVDLNYGCSLIKKRETFQRKVCIYNLYIYIRESVYLLCKNSRSYTSHNCSPKLLGSNTSSFLSFFFLLLSLVTLTRACFSFVSHRTIRRSCKDR